MFSIGVLKSLAAKVVEEGECDNLHEYFDIIYGVSTGAIIASLLALGKTPSEIQAVYLEEIPRIMGTLLRPARVRSAMLKRIAQKVFNGKGPDEFKTDVGVVAVDATTSQPRIFKTRSTLAVAGKSEFVPFFGHDIANAVIASCAAHPFFVRARLHATESASEMTLLDGGFVAANPTLFAIADALRMTREMQRNVSVLSVGTGKFPTSLGFRFSSFLTSLPLPILKIAPLLAVALDSSSTASAFLAQDLFGFGGSFRSVATGTQVDTRRVRLLRIDGKFDSPAASLVERRRKVLSQLLETGREEFRQQETAVGDWLRDSTTPQ